MRRKILGISGLGVAMAAVAAYALLTAAPTAACAGWRCGGNVACVSSLVCIQGCSCIGGYCTSFTAAPE